MHVPPSFPEGFLEGFVREHPVLARAILGFGACMAVFVIWLLVTR
jgi:hypothetical protein